jgi:hypothetical protein
MSYIVVNVSYPSDIANKVVEKYFEVIGKYTPDESLAVPVVPDAVKMTTQGVKVISVSEVKKGKLEEALAHRAKIMAEFNPVKGYEYNIDVYFTVEEALASMGMTLPK